MSCPTRAESSTETLCKYQNVAHLPLFPAIYKGKGKGHHRTGHEDPDEEQIYSSTLPLTSALDGGGWSTPQPGRFTPGEDPVPIVQKAVWAPGTVWTGAENLSSTGIRPQDRPARSESLYRLSYPGLIYIYIHIYI